MNKPLSHQEFEEALQAIGAEQYHDKHPFHQLLHNGQLSKGQVQAWALNRYCYQAAIPRKDAALVARCRDRVLRQEWTRRIGDHDGRPGERGGIERWLVLTTGLGLDPEEVQSTALALPATRFAVEAYVGFVAERSLLEAIASSLTELFAPKIHRERIAGMLENYDFITDSVMHYFRTRLDQAPRDVEFALGYVKEHAKTRAEQELVLAALRFKCSVLWAQLDALYSAYVAPGHIPPGAFRPHSTAQD
ncbi:MAG: pyrroloquinoline-quinone synthase PqqC [Hyphomicrobiaceae bacterium]